MTQWYFHASAQAERIGPLDDEAARRFALANPRALAWCQGMGGWTSIAEVPELQSTAPGMPSTPPPVPPTPAAAPTTSNSASSAMRCSSWKSSLTPARAPLPRPAP